MDQWMGERRWHASRSHGHAAEAHELCTLFASESPSGNRECLYPPQKLQPLSADFTQTHVYSRDFYDLFTDSDDSQDTAEDSDKATLGDPEPRTFNA